jgi:hypothetical protein
MVFTSSSTHSDGKPLSVRLLDPSPRTGEMLPGGGTDAALRSVAHLESHFGARAPDTFIDAAVRDWRETPTGFALAPAADAHS